MICNLSLTEEDQKVMTKGGRNLSLKATLRFAVFYLRKIGLLQSIEKGQISITSSGREFLATHEGPIREPDLQRFVSDEEKESFPQTLQHSNAEVASPDVRLAEIYQDISDQLSDEVLESVRSVSPQSFERLVNRLLSQMGYG